MEISHYNNILQATGGLLTTVDEFLAMVKNGTWKQQAEEIRAAPDKRSRDELKRLILPYVTISGKFGTRRKEDLIKHSGFICIDFDNIEDISATGTKLAADPYTYALFQSVSGNGLAVIVKISGSKHLDAFLGLETYYADKYQEYCDRACKDTTRARMVSYDPDTYINKDADTFRAYLPKAETTKKVAQVITGAGDMQYLMDQISQGSIDLTGGIYHRYMEISFALSAEYGEAGRHYFHFIASFNSKYNERNADRQYDNALKSEGSGIGIATLMYYAKNAGLATMHPDTKLIVSAAFQGKNAGRSIRETAELLAAVEGIELEKSEELITRVFKQENTPQSSKLSKLEQLELFLKTNCTLRRNLITRFIQNEGKEIDSQFLNSIYLRARKEVDDKMSFDEIDRMISSDFTEDFNPFIEFFSGCQDHRLMPEIIKNGYIKQLADCIETDTGDPSYKYHFLTKWMVGIISAAHGVHSPLLLCLTGGQGTGKTEFFRRLLPSQLHDYYAESKLDAGKDDDIMMTQKLLIMDDEFGGKNKQEAKQIKEKTSKEWFTLREPYGRKNVRLRRLAVLCGTSNEDTVLYDPTGNRRIIPIKVISLDHHKYNAIDKRALLMEAYKLWKDGFNWQLSKDDVRSLNKFTGSFEQVSMEGELLRMYVRKPSPEQSPERFRESVVFMQTSEIKVLVDKNTGEKLSVWKMGAELKNMGLDRVRDIVNGHRAWGYHVVLIDRKSNYNKNDEGEPGSFWL